jgi:hypothetical protein
MILSGLDGTTLPNNIDMIPIIPKPEPASFDGKVRTPGRAFLATNPNPKYNEWKSYWTKALDDLRTAYEGICAYSATWIPHSVGSHSVDHFISKDTSPLLAYEWTNFRYASGRFNGRKGNRIVLDPFLVKSGWFQINFNNMLIRPASNLSAHIQRDISNTIDVLHLNRDDKLVEERIEYINSLRAGHVSFDYIKQKAPLIAFEMVRQGLYPP